MGTIYATTPVRSPPVPPNTGGRKISVEKTVQFAGSIIYEDREVELEVSYLMLDCINCLGDVYMPHMYAAFSVYNVGGTG